MAIQPDGPSSKYNPSHHTTPPFRYTKQDKHVGCRTSGAHEPQDRLPMRDSISETAGAAVYSARHAPFGRRRRSPLATRPGAIQAGGLRLLLPKGACRAEYTAAPAVSEI